MKHILDFTVTSNRGLNSNTHLLVIAPKNAALPAVQPGQFAELRVDNSAAVFLRRPISINYVDYQANQLWLVIQKVGEGTRKLCGLQAGETVNLIFPLGKGFTFPEKTDEKLLIVGGGVGIAPLFFLASELKRHNFNCQILLGGRSKENLLQLVDFKKIGKVYATTEDGCFGERGFVTQHSILQREKFDRIYCCGPTPMMQAVAKYAIERKIDCEVSLENTMACGIGACLCCVTESTDGNVCVCSEGAVFDVKKLKWQ